MIWISERNSDNFNFVHTVAKNIHKVVGTQYFFLVTFIHIFYAI